MAFSKLHAKFQLPVFSIVDFTAIGAIIGIVLMNFNVVLSLSLLLWSQSTNNSLFCRRRQIPAWSPMSFLILFLCTVPGVETLDHSRSYICSRHPWSLEPQTPHNSLVEIHYRQNPGLCMERQRIIYLWWRTCSLDRTSNSAWRDSWSYISGRDPGSLEPRSLHLETADHISLVVTLDHKNPRLCM